MHFKFRTTACTALFLLFTQVVVFAATPPVRVTIKPSSEGIHAIRYQAGTKPDSQWSLVDATAPHLLLEKFDYNEDTLFIQQSEDYRTWTDTYAYRFHPYTQTWTVSTAAKNPGDRINALDIKLYGLLPAGSLTERYTSVVGAACKLHRSFHDQSPFTAYLEAGYSRGPSQSDWVEAMQACNLSVGVGYRFASTSKLNISTELGYGLIFHLLHGDLDMDGSTSLASFLDQQIRLSLDISYALSPTYALIASPLGVVFFEQESIATLFGLQTGLRIKY